ncbi:MAG: hypothetical protein ABI983_02010 [Acidobacteriota bacterium]
MRLYALGLSAVLAITLIPSPALAQGDFIKENAGKIIRKIGFHVSTSFANPIDTKNVQKDGSYGLSVGLAPGTTNGWGYPFGFAWFTEELRTPDGPSFMKFQASPVVGGIGYGWHFGSKLSAGAQLQAGYSFNSGKPIGDVGAAFGMPGVPINVDIGDTFVYRPQLKVEYFLTKKFTVRSSLNYVFENPRVVISSPDGVLRNERWNASNVSLGMGIGIYPFRK